MVMIQCDRHENERQIIPKGYLNSLVDTKLKTPLQKLRTTNRQTIKTEINITKNAS